MLDVINKKILQCLHENARQPNVQIGRQVGLSSPAVAERVKRMEDAGIIKGYQVMVDHAKVGSKLQAIITLRAFVGRLKPFLEKVKEFPEVLNCYRITGNENIVMEVVLDDQFHLERFIDQLINYGETRTHIVLSNIIENAIHPK